MKENVNEINRNQNSWITPDQELLLRASLNKKDEALPAWELWRSNVDFDKIDAGSYRLLPLLYSNLSKQKINDPLMERLKGIYRRTWYENQMLSHRAAFILENIHRAGIKTMLLKGIAMIHLYYKDYALRPMTDFDFMIPEKQAVEVFKILKDSGWNSANKNPENLIPIIHSADFSDPSGLHRIDLHWHLFLECCHIDADQDFWDNAVPTKFQERQTYVLNPTDQLLHTCIHGMKWCIIPPFRWVADAMMIINNSGREIDWNRLITLAQQRRLILPLQQGLEYLQNNFNADIPINILNAIDQIPITKHERIEYNYKIENHKNKFLGNIPVFWFDYIRTAENKSFKNNLIGFIKYVKFYWNLESTWQLPLYALVLSIAKIKIIFNSSLEKH
jgi:hypothetical protein